MPLRDRHCQSCNWVKADNYEPRTAMAVPCPQCGAADTTIVYVGSSVAIHGDDKFIGGKTFENMGDQPVTVHSRSEYKRELAARGLQEFVRHNDSEVNDRLRNTKPWV